MAARKSTKVEEAEKQEEVVDGLITEDKVKQYDEYFSAGLDRDGLTYPKNYYDIIVFNAEEYRRYSYGTAAGHAYDALKEDGYFVMNTNGTALKLDNILAIMELFFTHVPDESRDGFFVFQKQTKIKEEEQHFEDEDTDSSTRPST